ncbi:hypothetical protein U1Q18_048429 [Sarracenia purpurea var. burkii]
MVLNVTDLQCHCCYRKVKRILCRFPQIRNQIYDEKQNKVTITVVCCNPEKFRDKLCCRGGKTIKSIEIKEPEKPKPPPEKPKPPPEEKPKPPPEKPPEKPKPPPEKPKPPPCQPPVWGWCTPAYPTCCGQCYQGQPGGPCHNPPPEKPKPPPEEKPKPPPEKPPEKPKPPPEKPKPPPCQPPVWGWCPPAYPTCCGQCYQGQPGGPCHNRYESRPVPSYDQWSYGYGHGYGHGGCTSRCGDYEENTSGCTIM